ncbi:hypothetical protein DQ244_10815 [Blastococcus sp. TBT05-19]|nr:hypothetical protein DQ244_10815 [Blastococcus sp. TBT05-19]
MFEDALSAATALEQGKFVERPTSVKEEYSISWLSGADAEKIGSQYFDEGHLADLLNKFDAVEDLRSLLSFVQALHVSPAVDVSVTASELLRDMAMFIDNAKDDILSQYHDLSPRAWKLVAHLLYAAAPEAAGDSSA